MLKKMLKSLLPVVLVIAMLFSQAAFAEVTVDMVDVAAKEDTVAVTVSGAQPNEQVAILIYEDAIPEGEEVGNGVFDLDEDVLYIWQVDADENGNAVFSATFPEATEPGTKAVAFGAESSTAAYLATDSITIAESVTATFVIGDGAEGTVPEAQTVFSGENVTMPEQGDLTNGDKVFAGWSDGTTTYEVGATVAISADTTFTAVWNNPAPTAYTVTWVDEDGTVLETDENVEVGTMPTYDGEEPVKAGDAQYSYTFTGWTPEVVAVEADATYTATYTETVNEYTITWIVDGNETTEEYEYGATPAFTGSTDKAADAQYTYTFTGWDAEVVAVTGNATYTAQYSTTVNSYTIKFVDEDGTELQSSEVAYGVVPTAPADPTKAGDAQYSYTFAGWTPEVVAVEADATYTATYTETVNKYTVTWIVDGNETTEEYEYGATPAFTGSTDKAADAQYTYTFTGWDAEVVAVTGNATYTAQYSTTVNTYTVTWVDEDGTELEVDTDVEYGATPSYDGEEPAKEADAQYSYTFAGWDPEVATVTGDVTYTAQYDSAVNEYTITWVVDGVETEETYAYGATPVFTGSTDKAADAQYTYTFAGWDPEVADVTADATYTATYTSEVNEYTVTFVGMDGETISEQTVAYGAAAVAPEAPVVEGYTFTGWDKEFNNITADLTVTAQYEENEPTTWKATFEGLDVVIEEDITEGGVEIILPNAPAAANKVFAGWAAGTTFLPAGAAYTLAGDTAFEAVWVSISMLDGAAIRLDKTNPGIRFISYVDNAGFAKIKELDADATCGTILVNNDVRDDVDFKVETLKENSVFYKGVPAKAFAQTNISVDGIDHNVDEFRVVMVIKESDGSRYFNMNFGARSYVKYTYTNGDESMIYADFDEAKNVRSAKGVATAALADENAPEYTEEQLEVLNMYAETTQDTTDAE